MTGLLAAPYGPGQMTYDLRRLGLSGLICRIEHTNRYVLTPDGVPVQAAAGPVVPHRGSWVSM